MKLDHSNKLDLCYYGQVNSLRLKSNVVLKKASKHLWSHNYFAGDGRPTILDTKKMETWHSMPSFRNFIIACIRYILRQCFWKLYLS